MKLKQIHDVFEQHESLRDKWDLGNSIIDNRSTRH